MEGRSKNVKSSKLGGIVKKTEIGRAGFKE